MSSDAEFTKENLDLYLKELAKEYVRLGGKKAPCEIVLVGGASILANYRFRQMTNDMDAISAAPSIMKEAIQRVGDRFELGNNWLNSDFKRTKSFSTRLRDIATYYKQFSHVLEVRTIDSEYLVAMKLMSGRQYKSDFSDIVGIISEHQAKGSPLTMEQIDKAVCYLYGSWDEIPQWIKKPFAYVMEHADDPALYAKYREQEEKTKETLLSFQDQYPDTLNEENLEEILKKLQEREQEK